MPGKPHPHPLHGFGWLARWQIVSADATSATLRHDYVCADWPSAYRAEQRLTLTEDGYVHELLIQNRGDEAMPAGLGLHPYFIRKGARLSLAVDGCWSTDAEALPVAWTALPSTPDWFGDEAIDTLFTGREGPIVIDWPGMRLTIRPDAELGETVVYVPAGGSFFCVEPVSHGTNAINTAPDDMRQLQPGERWRVAVRFSIASNA